VGTVLNGITSENRYGYRYGGERYGYGAGPGTFVSRRCKYQGQAR
jgi:hypothetical protein